jgi:hypothetical protein
VLGFAQKVFPLSEPGAVATGPRLNLTDPTTIFRVNLWPVATAPGSDMGHADRLSTFCAKPLCLFRVILVVKQIALVSCLPFRGNLVLYLPRYLTDFLTSDL